MYMRIYYTIYNVILTRRARAREVTLLQPRGVRVVRSPHVSLALALALPLRPLPLIENRAHDTEPLSGASRVRDPVFALKRSACPYSSVSRC